jgi:hypothetical protein
MENQDIFNTVVNGLREQGCKSGDQITETIFNCLYRDKDGNKCGAGWIIPDEHYSKSMEFKSFVCTNEKTRPAEAFREVAKILGLTGENCILIDHLQVIHDDSPVGDWEEQWETLARNFNLEMPVRLLEN